jgi:hypothetical protein
VTDQAEEVEVAGIEEPKPDLGVLFVHGIGQQRRGDTLLAAGEALHEWLSRWYSRGQLASGAWGGVLTHDPEDPRAPAHVMVSISDKEVFPKWLVAESWWAESFAPPSFNDLAIWGFFAMPWSLQSHFGARCRRSLRRVRDATGRWQSLGRVIRLSFDVLLLLLAYVLLVPLVMVVLLLAGIGAIPVRRIRAFVGSLQRAIAGGLGDSYALLTSHVQAAAIRETVARDIRWLVAKCDRVAVVAHSQGAAITHRVLRGGEATGVSQFISVGSGLNKLDDLDKARRESQLRQHTPRYAPLTPYTGSVGLTFIAVAVPWIVVAARNGNGLVGQIVLGLAGLMLLLTAMAEAWRGHQPRAEEVGLPTSIDWIDIFSVADPVPNGALLDSWQAPAAAAIAGAVAYQREDRPEDGTLYSMPHSYFVHNWGSVLRDHSGYWKNRDGFMGVVALWLSRLVDGLRFARLSRLDRSRLEVAPRRRRWRVLWLNWMRLVFLAVAVGTPAVLWLRDDLASVGTPLTSAIEWLIDLLPGVDTTIADNGTADIVAVLTILVGAFIAFWMVRWLWRWWGYVETHRLYRRFNDDLRRYLDDVSLARFLLVRLEPTYQGVPLQLLVLVSVAILFVEVAAVIAAGWSEALGEALWAAAGLTVGLAIGGSFVYVFAVQMLVSLWQWGFLGPPRPFVAERLYPLVAVPVLVAFPAMAYDAAEGGDVSLWWIAGGVLAFMVGSLLWPTGPVVKARRHMRVRASAGHIDLAHLRWVDDPGRRREILKESAEDVLDVLVGVEVAIPSRDAKSAETFGKQETFRSLHERAWSGTQTAKALRTHDAKLADDVLIACAPFAAEAAATLLADGAGRHRATAIAALERHRKWGPRRDRRVARRALRESEAAGDERAAV